MGSAGLYFALLVSLATAFPLDVLKRDPISGARTNDVICEMRDYLGNSQYPPPVVITYPDGTTTCGCASDIVTGGNGSYTECNQIYPSFGQTGYDDQGLRQNACYLDSAYVATCATSCTPNTSPNDDGTCSPTNPSSYSLQSPTTEYGAATQTTEAPAETTTTWSSSQDSSQDTWTSDTWTSDSWTSDTWTTEPWNNTSVDAGYDPSSEFMSATTSSEVSAGSDVPATSTPTSTSTSIVQAEASSPSSIQSSAAQLQSLSMSLCGVVLFAGLCI